MISVIVFSPFLQYYLGSIMSIMDFVTTLGPSFSHVEWNLTFHIDRAEEKRVKTPKVVLHCCDMVDKAAFIKETQILYAAHQEALIPDHEPSKRLKLAAKMQGEYAASLTLPAGLAKLSAKSK